MTRQLFLEKNASKNVKNQHALNGRMDFNYRVVTFSTLYLTILGIIIPSLKSIGQVSHTYINKYKKIF